MISSTPMQAAQAATAGKGSLKDGRFSFRARSSGTFLSCHQAHHSMPGILLTLVAMATQKRFVPNMLVCHEFTPDFLCPRLVCIVHSEHLQMYCFEGPKLSSLSFALSILKCSQHAVP